MTDSLVEDGSKHCAIEQFEALETPAYRYDLCVLADQIKRFQRMFSGYPVELLFATMANDRPEILTTISGLGVGACVNSIRHMKTALENGFSHNAIHFTSSGTPLKDMEELRQLGVRVNLDSPSQVAQWCRIEKGAAAGIRLNAAHFAVNAPSRDRLGVDRQGFAEAIEAAEKWGGRINGVHVYAGTNQLKASLLLSVIDSIFDFVEDYPLIEYVNLGGGIGVDYLKSGLSFDYEDFGQSVANRAKTLSVGRDTPIQVFFEPGRSLVASCGTFLTRVTDIKRLGGTNYATVDASIATFPRPFHHPESAHRIRLVKAKDNSISKTMNITVCGRTTFSRDILGTADVPTHIKVGDLLAIEDAGAYCESMTSRFLGQQEPTIVVCGSD